MSCFKVLYLLLAVQTFLAAFLICVGVHCVLGVMAGCGIGFIVGLIRAEKKLDELVEKFRSVKIGG